MYILSIKTLIRLKKNLKKIINYAKINTLLLSATENLLK